MRSYRITLRDRETQTVVGYYDGSWTTDRRRALDLRKREVAEAHAGHMRERCPRNADLIKVEELERCRLALSAGGMGLVTGTRERALHEVGSIRRAALRVGSSASWAWITRIVAGPALN